MGMAGTNGRVDADGPETFDDLTFEAMSKLPGTEQETPVSLHPAVAAVRDQLLRPNTPTVAVGGEAEAKLKAGFAKLAPVMVSEYEEPAVMSSPAMERRKVAPVMVFVLVAAMFFLMVMIPFVAGYLIGRAH